MLSVVLCYLLIEYDLAFKKAHERNIEHWKKDCFIDDKETGLEFVSISIV